MVQSCHREAGAHLVDPVRAGDAPVAGLGVRCGHHRSGARWPDEGNVDRRPVEGGCDQVGRHGAHHAQQGPGGPPWLGQRSPRSRHPVHRGALRHHRGHPSVPHGRDDHVPAPVGGAPQGDPAGVDIVPGPGVAQGGEDVVDLPPGVEQLPRLAATVTEVPVVDHQDVEPGVSEPLCVGLQAAAFRASGTVGHHHARPAPGPPGNHHAPIRSSPLVKVTSAGSGNTALTAYVGARPEPSAATCGSLAIAVL